MKSLKGANRNKSFMGHNKPMDQFVRVNIKS